MKGGIVYWQWIVCSHPVGYGYVPELSTENKESWPRIDVFWGEGKVLWMGVRAADLLYAEVRCEGTGPHFCATNLGPPHFSLFPQVVPFFALLRVTDGVIRYWNITGSTLHGVEVIKLSRQQKQVMEARC